jgi:1-acyl-sn-glycerol-3-phosphate acyltransferase
MIIRSLLFNIAFWLTTFILGIVELIFGLFTQKYVFAFPRLWNIVTLWFLRVLCGITHEVRGREHIPASTALIASKHQSAWDTIIFWSLLEKPTFVLKRSLIYIPVFGWVLLMLKSIYIDRSAGAAAMKRMLREARARISEGRIVVIFPEGTRTPPGESGTYHPGVAAMYQHLNLPVTPVALNSGLCWGRNSFQKKPGVITIEFLAPIPAGMKSREFLPLLKERIETASGALLEAGTKRAIPDVPHEAAAQGSGTSR